MLSRFVASPTSKPAETVDDPALVEDVRCVVKLKVGNVTRDLLVGTQPDGALTVVDLDRSKLSQRVHAQLAFHEVASGRAESGVTLEVTELYVFDLQVLELLMDAPGLNDAMYLYGVLRGPYPATPGVPVQAIEGQLTVTRSDLLSALVDGVRDAFRYQPEIGGSRCVHALLPGERDAIIDGGRGAVLAFPLAPAWSLESHAANDKVAAQMFFDVLGAFYRDAAIVNELPVPSRQAAEHELVANGWTIEGGVATRKTKGGLLGLGTETEKRPLPREGTLEEFVAAANAATSRLGPPSPETLALRRRRGAATPALLASPPLPRATAPAAQPVVQARQPRPQVATSTDWMKDFVDAHQSQGHKKPKVVAPARAVTRKATPDWMADFADPDDQAGPKSDGGEQSSPKRGGSK
jgi:hypothetical protein